MDSLTPYDIAQMIDISAVRADSTDDKIATAIDCAKKYGCYLVTILPSQTRRALDLLAGATTPKVGGNVGFPSGGQTVSIKSEETIELVKMGVDEIDMVIDIAAHLSGRFDDVYRDIAEVVAAAQGHPVKVILECHYLDEYLIRKGCDLAIKAGAAFVKTGTGWTPTGATLENISLIKSHVGDAIKIKASGGIRDLDTLLEMRRRGADRFGINLVNVEKIMRLLNGMQQPSSTQS